MYIRGAEYTTAHIGPLEGTSPTPASNGTDPDNPDHAPMLGAEAEVVDLESYRRWFLVHVLGAYYMTGVVLFLLWRAYEEYLQLRHAFRQRPAPENCAWGFCVCFLVDGWTGRRSIESDSHLHTHIYMY